MNKICTSIEQSKKLLELWLNPETADMCYIETPNKEYRLLAYPIDKGTRESKERGWNANVIPAWSLGALIELIPHTSCLNKDGMYYYEWSDISTSCVGYTTDEYENIIDAAYDLIVCLLENGYIKKINNSNDKGYTLFKWKSLEDIPTEHWANNYAISPMYLVKCEGTYKGEAIIGYSHYSFAINSWIDCCNAMGGGIHKVIAWSDIKL